MANGFYARDADGDAGLCLSSLNHVSILCRSLPESVEFYRRVLGFTPVRRPGSLDFTGYWFTGYGIGIHLLQAENPEAMPPLPEEIHPKGNHISFQCKSSMEAVEKKLREMGIRYVKQRVEEGGFFADQIFFHDPDGFMIEICNCENIPVMPLQAGGGGMCELRRMIRRDSSHKDISVA